MLRYRADLRNHKEIRQDDGRYCLGKRVDREIVRSLQAIV